jgi:hypothetical protein
MLDVHPPHHPTHTWKDFFIHMATISVGLLIAIGLEQTVEVIHHRHQRDALEQELRAEGMRNLHIALGNIEFTEAAIDQLTEQFGELQEMAGHHQPPRERQSPTGTGPTVIARPAVSAWVVAQQNGSLELLPHDEAQRFVRVYSVAQMVSAAIDQVNTDRRAYSAARDLAVVDASTLRAVASSPKSTDLSLLDPQQVAALRQSTATLIEAQREFIGFNLFLYGADWASLKGVRSDDEILHIIYDARAAYSRGGRPALLAQYPLPVEAGASAGAAGEK